MIDPDFIKFLCCPETRQALALANPSLVASLNAQIAAGTLRNRSQQPVAQSIDGGLVRADGQCLYPIREDIPVLIVEEAIPLPLS